MDIIIWGAGGHAKVVAESARRSREFHIVGFVDEVDPLRTHEAFCGSVILGRDEALARVGQGGEIAVFFAFGNNGARNKRWQEMRRLGCRFPSIIDPHAAVAADAEIGPGTYVAAGAIIQPSACIGAQVIVNTGAIVEHDAQIGDGVHLCPRVCLAGHVEVGAMTTIGAGSQVRDRVKIGAGSFIGMGSNVVGNIPPNVTAWGNPARVTRMECK